MQRHRPLRMRLPLKLPLQCRSLCCMLPVEDHITYLELVIPRVVKCYKSRVQYYQIQSQLCISNQNHPQMCSVQEEQSLRWSERASQ